MGALAQQSARSSFGQYVKQKRVERPAADPVGAAIEEATREQREASALEAQQSSLSAFSQSQLSLNAGKARGKFGVRLENIVSVTEDGGEVYGPWQESPLAPR